MFLCNVVIILKVGVNVNCKLEFWGWSGKFIVDKLKAVLYNKKAIYCIYWGDEMKNIDVLNIMDGKHALFGFFFAFNNRLQTAGDSFYEEITCKQFFLMACMSLFQDSAPTANDLAKVMGCSRQNVKEILTSLEKKGFVALNPCETDKRKRMVVLTEKAEKTALKYREKEIEFLEKLYEGVSDEEIKSVYHVLSKMEDNLNLFNEEITQ